MSNVRRWSTKDLADFYKQQGRACPILDACGDGQTRTSKFNVAHPSARTFDGIVFDSAREMFHYRSLKIAAQAGAITELTRQPRFVLQAAFKDNCGKLRRAVTFKADFGFTRDGQKYIIDVKSKPTMTAASQIRWKLAIAQNPGLRFEVWT